MTCPDDLGRTARTQMLRYPECSKPFDVVPGGSGSDALATPLNGSRVELVHPCTLFANGAGYGSWADVVAAVEAGKFVLGPAPKIGKPVGNLQWFCAGVEKAGFQWASFPDETGRVVVGLPEKLGELREHWSKTYPPTLGSFLGSAPPARTVEEWAADLNAQIARGVPAWGAPAGDPQTTGEPTIAHPCDVFASKAGYASWPEAVAAAREGKVLKGHGERIAMTMMAAQTFSEAVARAGLRWVEGADGRVCVGLADVIEPERARVARISPDHPDLACSSNVNEHSSGDSKDRLVVVKQNGEAVAVLGEDPASHAALAGALREARDAMLTMAAWAEKSDPAGHSWAVRMVDRASAALGEPTPASPPDAESDMAISRVVEFAKTWHWRREKETIAKVDNPLGGLLDLQNRWLQVLLLYIGANSNSALDPVSFQRGGALFQIETLPAIRRVKDFVEAWRYQRASQQIAEVQDGPETCCVLAVEDLEAVLKRLGAAAVDGQSEPAKS